MPEGARPRNAYGIGHPERRGKCLGFSLIVDMQLRFAPIVHPAPHEPRNPRLPSITETSEHRIT